MKLKTLVKHLIMQWPGLFPNALAVYDHLFYVIGNGYNWKNGELYYIGFKTKTKEQCIQAIIDHYTEQYNDRVKELTAMKDDKVISEEENLINLLNYVKLDMQKMLKVKLI